jgi:hypothetical protein
MISVCLCVALRAIGFNIPTSVLGVIFTSIAISPVTSKVKNLESRLAFVLQSCSKAFRFLFAICVQNKRYDGMLLIVGFAVDRRSSHRYPSPSISRTSILVGMAMILGCMMKPAGKQQCTSLSFSNAQILIRSLERVMAS